MITLPVINGDDHHKLTHVSVPKVADSVKWTIVGITLEARYPPLPQVKSLTTKEQTVFTVTDKIQKPEVFGYLSLSS